MRLSKNFHLNEFVKSSTADRMAIDNSPKDDEHLVNLVVLAHQILQPIREEHGVITLNSGYRSPDLNKAVGGSSKSQHCRGEAADFESSRVSNPDLAKWIEKNLDFDQLILEFYDGKNPNSGWVHCSFNKMGENRNKTLTALRVKGKTQYKNGLLS